jgi:hypothetical protein
LSSAPAPLRGGDGNVEAEADHKLRPKFVEIFLNNLVNWNFAAMNFA